MDEDQTNSNQATLSLERPPRIDEALATALALADLWFDEGIELFEWPAAVTPDLRECVERLLYHNFQVWHYEDYGRTDEDRLILVGWRGALRHNEHRNDLVNAIDDFMAPFNRESAELHSESLGTLVDRVTILYLEYRNAVPRCTETAVSIKAQLDELTAYAADLQRRIEAGEVRFQRVPRRKLCSVDDD